MLKPLVVEKRMLASLCSRSYSSESARRIAQRLKLHSSLIEHRQQEIRHRRVIFIFQVASAFQAALASADQQIRQWEVVMRVAIAHVAAIEQHGVIEQRAIAVGRLVQLVDELTE